MIPLETTSGSDLLLTVTINDDAGPVDLTGRSVVIFGATQTIANRVSASITDAINGIISLVFEGSSPIPAGQYTFRMQINTLQGNSIGLPIFSLSIK